ncbi:MAG: alpha/beta fold hydrolase [Flavobacteriales bacterium]
MLYHEIHHIGDDKEWLVFIHGAGGAVETWKYQVNAFTPHFNLLLLDLRDHGKSKNVQPHYDDYNFEVVTSDILHVIDHIGIEKANFMSLSLGSILLQQIDIHRPSLINKQVMAGGVFKATKRMSFFLHSAKVLNFILPYRALYNMFSWIVLPRKNHRFSRMVFRIQSKKLTPKEYLKWVGLYNDFFKKLKEYFYRPVDKVSLIVMGDQDHVFFKAARQFSVFQDQVKLEVMKGCGHVCNIEQPKLFNEVALRFLNAKSA